MKLSKVNRTSITIPDRFRKEYGNTEQLANSISSDGLIHPIALLETDKDKYTLLAGGRRMQAIDILGWDKIPARIYTKDENVDELKATVIELMENIERKDLTPQEKCDNVRAVHEAMLKKHGPKKNPTDPDDPGWSKRKTAELLGRTDYTQVNQEIALSEASDVMPDIFQGAKNITDAKKVLDVRVKKHRRQEAAKLVETALKKTPKGIRKKKIIDNFIIGDVLSVLSDYPSASIDMIEMDPPYGIDILEEKKKVSETNQLDRAEYSEVTKEEYKKFMLPIIKECHRVLKEDRWMLCWFGPEPWFGFVASWLKQAGFTLKMIPGIWNKGGAWAQTMQPKYNLANAYEMFFYARKGKAFIQQEGRSNMFEYRPIHPQKKVHETEKPIELYTDIIKTFAPIGSDILIPCCGSGNAILAADNHQCNAVGIDMSSENKDSFVMKVNVGKPGEWRSYDDTNGK